MAYTTPRTYVVGEVHTAAHHNTYERDNVAHLHGDGGAVSYGAGPFEFGGTVTASAGAIVGTVDGAAIYSVVRCGQSWTRWNAAGDTNHYINGPGGSIVFRNAAVTQNNVVLTDAGGLAILGDFTVNTDKVSITGSSGDTSVKGTLSIGTAAQAAISAAGLPSGTLAPRVVIPASAFTPASSNGATLALVSTGSDKYELQFADGATVKDAAVSLAVPTNYAGGSITIKLLWYIAGASQQVYWNVLGMPASADTGPDSTPTSRATASATSSGTSGYYTVTTLTWSSGAGLPAAGDALELVIRRDPTQAWDTSTATAKLRSVVVEFGS